MLKVSYILSLFLTYSFLAYNQKTAEDLVQDGFEKVVSNNHKGAITDFTKALKINPSLTEAYVARAKSKKSLGKLQSAIADYNHVLKINPYDPESYNVIKSMQ